MSKTRNLLFMFLLTLGCELLAAGLRVEAVRPGGAAETGGLKTGDLLLGWERTDSTGSSLRGELNTGWDWMEAEAEIGDAACTLIGKRGETPLRITLRSTPWRADVAPLWEGEESMALEAGLSAFRSGDRLVAARAWSDGARAFMAAGKAERAAWLALAALSVQKEPKGDEAGARYDEILQLLSETSRTLPETAARAICLDQSARGNALRGRDPEALAAFSAERELRRKLGTRGALADCLRQMGAILSRNRKAKDALPLLQESVELRRARGDAGRLLAVSLESLGTCLRETGEFKSAVTALTEARSIYERIAPGSLDLASCCNTLGGVLLRMRDLQGTEAQYRRALEIREKLAPGTNEHAASLNNMGIVAGNRGDTEAAEDFYRRSLAIKEKLAPGSAEVARSLNNVGTIAMSRGDLVRAEDCYVRALAIWEKVAPESDPMASTLSNLGQTSMTRLDFVKTESYLRRALAILEKSPGMISETARCQANLGIAAFMRKDLDAAEGFLGQALKRFESIRPDSADVARVVFNLGRVSYERGDLDKAEELCRRAQSIREKLLPGSLDVAFCLDFLGTVALARKGDPAQAETPLKAALEIRHRLAPGTAWEAMTLHGLGQVRRRQTRMHEALDFFRQAVDALESQRWRLGGGREAQELFSTEFADYYRDLAEAQLEVGKKAEAFHTLERYRAQVLLRMMAEREWSFAGQVSPALSEEERRVDRRVATLRRQLEEASSVSETGRVDELLTQLADAEKQQEGVRARIRKEAPRVAALQYPVPMDLPHAAASLEKGTCLLGFSTGEENLIVYTLLDGQLTMSSLPLSRKSLTQAVEAFRRMLGDPSTSADRLLKRGEQLGGQLMDPVRPVLSKARHLLVSPDGPLHALPFAALALPGTGHLVERHSLSTIVSATLYAEVKGGAGVPSSRRETLAAFGDPIYPGRPASGEAPRGVTLRGEGLEPLPSTRQEVEAICSRFPKTGAHAFLGKEATESAARSIGPETGFLHFACHGLLDERFPMNSGLVLSIPERRTDGGDDGILEAWEVIENLHLDASLVALSACRTGLGADRGGEGLVGLSRAFLFAGARGVLASLWPVADEGTALFMGRLYAYLSRGMSRAEALRQTQLDFLHPGRKPGGKGLAPFAEQNHSGFASTHPFHWAGFSLTGDWR